MEVFVLVIWLVLVSVAAPLMLLGAFNAPWLLVPGLAALGGFTLAAVTLAFDLDYMAWAAFGLAVVGAVGAGLGGAQIIDDEPHGSGTTGGGVETAALLAGVAVPLFLVTVCIALGTALTETRILDPL